MRTPLVVVTGVDETAMDGALMSLSWGIADAVVVRHRIDPVTQVLSRVVSDATGVLDRAEVELEHACITCALREDVLPTLDRLARERRWSAIVSGLPVATEAQQVATAVTRDPRLARRLRLSRLVTAVPATGTADVLLSDATLEERGLQVGPDDDRGVGEVACAQVEVADTVVVDGDPGAEQAALVRALARPDAQVLLDCADLDPDTVLRGRHATSVAAAWAMPSDDRPAPAWTDGHAWRLDLSSPRPFHPDRLLDRVETLGAGPFRSRGCFWLPTRPGVVQQWAGAGGQLSIGSAGDWGRRMPLTRIVLTGLGPAPDELAAAFEDLLVTPEEALLDQRSWHVAEDGLEPWLGDLRDAA
jgi:G3E family GTPase